MRFQIKDAREKAGFSQKELAKLIGVAPNTFHGYESGKHDPKSELLKKIADACDVSVDFLLGRTPPEDKKKPEGVNTNPKLDTLLSICKILGCSPNDLVENKNEKKPDTSIAMPGERNEDLIVLLGQMIAKRGYMKPEESLSDVDHQFLTYLIGLIDTYFEQRGKS